MNLNKPCPVAEWCQCGEMRRWCAAKLVPALVLVLAIVVAGGTVASQPHIIFIFADDLGKPPVKSHIVWSRVAGLVFYSYNAMR